MFADRIKEIKELKIKEKIMSDNLRQYPPSENTFPKTGGKIDYSGQIDISEEVFEDLVAQYKRIKDMEENNLSLEQVPSQS